MVPVFELFDGMRELGRWPADISRFVNIDMPDGAAKGEGRWGFPFEIQVMNEAALEYCNHAHKTYEIERVSERIAWVCLCSKDAEGHTLPQLECQHCIYRKSHGLGYCPFCHICHQCKSQQKDCTCHGEVTDETRDM